MSVIDFLALPYTVRSIRGSRGGGGQKVAKMVPKIVKRAGTLDRHLRVQEIGDFLEMIHMSLKLDQLANS